MEVDWRRNSHRSFSPLLHPRTVSRSVSARVTLGKPRQVHVAGTHAYVVVPTNLRYNEKGRLIKTTGLMTLALHKGAEGWRIGVWAWAWGDH
jgi:ketosteroid isomerase-like protein